MYITRMEYEIEKKNDFSHRYFTEIYVLKTITIYSVGNSKV